MKRFFYITGLTVCISVFLAGCTFSIGESGWKFSSGKKAAEGTTGKTLASWELSSLDLYGMLNLDIVDDYTVTCKELGKDLEFDLGLSPDEKIKDQVIYEDDNGTVTVHECTQDGDQWMVYFDFIGKGNSNLYTINLLETYKEDENRMDFNGQVEIGYTLDGKDYSHKQHWNSYQILKDRERVGFYVFYSDDEMEKAAGEDSVTVHFKMSGLTAQTWKKKQ